MAEIELSNGRHRGDFPAEWGIPPGTQHSEDRAAWVLRNVRKMEADPRQRLRRLDRAVRDRQRAEVDGLIALIGETRLPKLAAQLRRLRDAL